MPVAAPQASPSGYAVQVTTPVANAPVQTAAPMTAPATRLRAAPPSLELPSGTSQLSVFTLPSPQARIISSPLPSSGTAVSSLSVVRGPALPQPVYTAPEEAAPVRAGLDDVTTNVTNVNRIALTEPQGPVFPGLEPLVLGAATERQRPGPMFPGLAPLSLDLGASGNGPCAPSPLSASATRTPGGIYITGLRSPGPVGSPVTAATTTSKAMPAAKKSAIRRL